MAYEERCCWEKPVGKQLRGGELGGRQGAVASACHLPSSAASRLLQCGQWPSTLPVSLGGDRSGSQPREWVWEVSRGGAHFRSHRPGKGPA